MPREFFETLLGLLLGSVMGSLQTQHLAQTRDLAGRLSVGGNLTGAFKALRGFLQPANPIQRAKWDHVRTLLSEVDLRFDYETPFADSGEVNESGAAA